MLQPLRARKGCNTDNTIRLMVTSSFGKTSSAKRERRSAQTGRCRVPERGTRSSNPAPSSGELGANRVEVARDRRKG